MLKIFRHYTRKFRRTENPSISSGNISFFSCNEGFKIFNLKKELTKNVGLCVSWLDGNVMKDSSRFKTETQAWLPNRLNVMKCPGPDNLFPCIIFDYIFSGAEPAVIKCVIKIKSDKPIRSLKVSLMMDRGYKTWMAGIYEGEMPAIKAWHKVGLPDSAVDFAGLKNIEAINNSDYLAPLILSFPGAVHSIENSDISTSSRLICAQYSGIFTELTITGEIIVFLKNNQLNEWIVKCRNNYMIQNKLLT